MHELLSKTKFVNALVREHVSIDATRKERGQETHAEYLRLDLLTPSPRQKDKRLSLDGLKVVRDFTETSFTPAGVIEANKLLDSIQK